MLIDVEGASLRKAGPLRAQYREELNCQIVHDSWHERGFLQSYLISVAGRVVGYGSVGGVGELVRGLEKVGYVVRPSAAGRVDVGPLIDLVN
jgi:hypothetical protein